MAVQERYLVRARAFEGQVGTGRLWKPCPRADSVPASAQIVKLCLDNMGVGSGSTLAPEFPQLFNAKSVGPRFSQPMGDAETLTQ